MTKQEVRAAALAKLAVRPTDTLWDVGAGTGSASVELALAAPRGHVYAVECAPDACALIRQNREKFHAYNLSLIEGTAPQVLADLPAPDVADLPADAWLPYLPEPDDGITAGAKGRALGALARLRALPILAPVARAIPQRWQTRVKSWLRG